MTVMHDDVTPFGAEVGFFGAEGADGAAALDPAVIELVAELVAAAPPGREGLLTVLLGLQRAFERVSWRIQELVAERYGMSPVQVAGLVSFYPGLSAERKGRLKVEVCTGTNCHLRDGGRLLEALGGVVDPDPAATGEPRFAIVPERCLGLCGLAPVVRVNDRVQAELEAEDAGSAVGRWLASGGWEEDSG